MFQKDNLRDVEIVSDEFLREFSLRWICYIVMLQVCGNCIGFLSAPLILQAGKDLLSIVKNFIYTHCHRKVYLHIFQFQAIGRSTNGSTIRLGVSMKTMILLGLMIMFTTCCQISAVCTPFTYTRGSACSENLAASTFPHVVLWTWPSSEDFVSCRTLRIWSAWNQWRGSWVVKRYKSGVTSVTFPVFQLFICRMPSSYLTRVTTA